MMRDEAFDALRAAVNYARESGAHTKLAMVRTRLQLLGFSDDVIVEALELWADYQHRVGLPQADTDKKEM